MTELIQKGQWVQIHAIILEKGERAPHVPEDTAGVPLEMRAKGFLRQNAKMGDTVAVTTLSGRTLEGRLEAVNPPSPHDFGAPAPELLPIAGQVRALIQENQNKRKAQ